MAPYPHLVRFVTTVERNVGTIRRSDEVSKVVNSKDFCFLLDDGPEIYGVNNERYGKVLIDMNAICQHYVGVESVELSIVYVRTGFFECTKIMPQEDNVGSDSTDSDYRAFLDDYEGSDVGSDPGMNAEKEAGSDAGSDSGSDAGSESIVTHV